MKLTNDNFLDVKSPILTLIQGT